MMTGQEHFAKAAEILAALDPSVRPAMAEDVPPAPGTAMRADMLQRAAIHAQLAQASAIVHCTPDHDDLGGSYFGYGEPER